MKMELTRDQRVDSLGKTASALSGQMAYLLSQMLETMGVRSVRLSYSQSMSGLVPDIEEWSYFDGVPQDIVKWSGPARRAIAELMAAFGMSSIFMSVESEADKTSLSEIWKGVSPSSEVMPPDAVRPWGMSYQQKMDVASGEKPVRGPEILTL